MASSVILPSNLDPKRYILVHTKKDDKWGNAAGTVETFEHPQDAATREVLEETGLTATIESLVGAWPIVSASGNYVLNIIYAGRIHEGIPAAKKKEGIDEVRAFSLDEIRELYRRKELRGLAHLRSIEDYANGKVFPLEIIKEIIR